MQTFSFMGPRSSVNPMAGSRGTQSILHHKPIDPDRCFYPCYWSRSANRFHFDTRHLIKSRERLSGHGSFALHERLPISNLQSLPEKCDLFLLPPPILDTFLAHLGDVISDVDVSRSFPGGVI